MNIPKRFAPLTMRAPRRDRHSAIVRFLTEIWDFHPNDYTMLYTRLAGTGRMQSHPIRDERAEEIAELLNRYPPKTHDIYFCPNAFDRPSNRQEHAIPTRYGWSDIDDASPAGFKPLPSVLWETSEGRYQGLWIWRDVVPAQTAERYSRNLWKRYGGDSGAWAANKLLRVPGTINHKPTRSGDYVRLLRFDGKPKRVPDAIAVQADTETPCASGNVPIDPSSHDPATVIRRYRRRVGPYVGTLMTANRPLQRGDMGRSEVVFLIAWALMDEGASNDEVASVLWVNAYFNAKWQGDLPELTRQINKIRTDWETGR